jgi:hypothetical protein
MQLVDARWQPVPHRRPVRFIIRAAEGSRHFVCVARFIEG